VAARVPRLELGAEVAGIDLEARRLHLTDGRRLAYGRLVATAALPAIVDLVRDPLPAAVREARRALRWVRVLNIGLGVEGPPPREEHWLYFADPEIPHST